MLTKPKKPFIPAEKHDTLRHEIVALLEERTLSARDISAEVHISEKDVYDHLEHISTALRKSSRHLLVTPSLCRKCGFEFTKRARLKKPGKCPVCSGEQIESPLFFIPPSQRHM